MRHHAPTLRLTFAALLAIAAVALVAATVAAQYSMTVNKDRLVNAQNEPQNWLMMNGDYGSMRYSKLSQISRENVQRRPSACSGFELCVLKPKPRLQLRPARVIVGPLLHGEREPQRPAHTVSRPVR